MANIKDPNEKVMVSLQIPSGLRDKSINAATALGMSFSPFVRKSLHLCAHFDPAFWSTIEHLAEIYGVGESKVLTNIVTRYVDDMKIQTGLGNEKKCEPAAQ